MADRDRTEQKDPGHLQRSRA